MRYLHSIINFVYALTSMAQTNIYIPASSNKYLNNTISPPSLVNYDNIIKQRSRVLSDNSGKVLLSFSNDVFNSKGDILIPADSLMLPHISGVYLQAVRLNDSLAALVWFNKHLDEKEAYKEQLLYTFIDFKFASGKGRTIIGKSNILLKTGEAKWMDICRTIDGFYLIAAQINEYLYLFKMDSDGVTQTDSLFNPTKSGYPNISKLILDTNITAKQESIFLQFSHSADFLISNIIKSISVLYPSNSPFLYESNTTSIIYFDKKSNKFVASKNQILNKLEHLRDSSYLTKPYIFPYFLRLLSPNNQFFYSENRVIMKYPYFKFNKLTDKTQYLQFDIQKRKYVDSIQVPRESTFSDYLSPFHTLNLFTFEDYFNPKLYTIDPNKSGFKGNMKFEKSYNQNLYIWNFIDMYEYVRIKVNVNYDCKATVDLINETDLSGGINKFMWVITNQSGKTDTLFGSNQKISYTKNGKYGFKVFASSDLNGGYGEWYYDTIEINIPSKPIAAFKAADTVICRYLPLQFTNLSHAKEIKPGSQEKYVWTFGDGGTSYDKEPTHTYTQPGYYTVSLFYSNGYCDSTLVKNQYIRVVDAPKPGFSAAVRQGCVPFTTQITDTVTLNVTKKEYLFTDSAKWKTINSSVFNYTFSKPGHYWAVQKLYGYTGCIIRTDSIRFFVSKGLLPSDSIAITLASFDTLNQLHLHWENHIAALSYNIYHSADGKNFSLYNNTSQTNAVIAFLNKAVYYKIAGLDSCGKLSSSKNIAKPQWIKGERLPANEASIIYYTPDEGLGIAQSTELEWSYHHAINLVLGEQNPVNPYRDEKFASPGLLKKCYRMSILHNGTKMYSNYECVNFEPQVFIPNSFTPNGDGLNDEFLPTTTGIIGYNLKIFNRWGELVYSGNSPWNGLMDTKPAQNEIYLYTLQIFRNDRKIQLHRGTLYLIR